MEYLTIEEAAHRLGVSVATARRWAAKGKIPATKSGKQWIVDGAQLRGAKRRRRDQTSGQPDLEVALRHVRSTDLSEPPVPDILRWEDELEDEDAVMAGARNRLEGGQLGEPGDVKVDKNALSTRRMTMLSLEDRVAYQALVASFAERVESRTSDAVYSARLSNSDRYFFSHQPSYWGSWRRKALLQLVDDQEWLVTTDLAAYFDTIPHRQLLTDLQAMNVDPGVIGILREMLNEWGITENFGLPQGPNASRLLGNLFLLPVDQAMLEEGWKYSRFMDDVLIVTNTRAKAVQAVRQFEAECRVRGLIMSSAKTKLLHGDAARRYLQESTKLGEVEYLLSANATALARKELKEILRAALKREAAIDERNAKFSLWRLAKLKEAGVLGRVLKRLEELAPLASVTSAYLQPFISRQKVVRDLAEFLRDPGRSYSPYLVTWLLAAMMEHPDVPESWIEQAMKRLKNRNEPLYLRCVAALVVGRGKRNADISWIRREIAREYDPRMLRAFTVALKWANQLDKATEKQLSARAPRLKRTLAYLKGRSSLPSLVYTRKRLELPTQP